jgi:hypothetical protein
MRASRHEENDWQARLRGAGGRLREAGAGAGRRLEPVGRAIHPLLSGVAPPVSSGMFAAVWAPVLGLAKLTDWGTAAAGWVVPRARALAAAFVALLHRHVTPVTTVAVVGAGAAIALGVSQFLDYRGIAVGEQLYEGEVGSVAPAPLTDKATAGSAHAWVLLPLALAALALIVGTATGRWRLGRAAGILGVVSIAVILAVDLPKGLDEGAEGAAYASSGAELLEGFWIELVASAVIALCGFLLARYVREQRGEASPARRPDPGKRPWSRSVPPPPPSEAGA